jgi:protein O-mannosyl-transferase
VPAHAPWEGQSFPTDNKYKWLLAIALVLVTFAAYSAVLKYPFVNYDDPDYVIKNPHVQQGISVSTVIWAVKSLELANWHPVTWLSHALDYDLFRLDARGHHFTSLLLHAANAVLVFLLLMRSTGALWRSWWVASLFALHPMNVESVAWVAERKSVLSMFFFLLTLGAYGWYVRQPNWKRYLVVTVLFVLALAAKPMVVTLPFVLLLLDFWPLKRIGDHAEQPQPSKRPVGQEQPGWRSLVVEKLPWLALSAASSVITIIAQRPAMKTMDAIPFGQRLTNAVFSYAMYLWKVFWPTRLSVYYAPQGSRLGGWQIALSLLLLATVSALAWRFRSRRYIPVGWLWFVGTLVPMIGLIQVGEQGMADRYAYLPFLGIFTLLTWTVADLCAAGRINVLIPIASSVTVIFALSYLTWRQVHTWESTLSLWSHSLAITPENCIAEDSIGTILLEEGVQSTGQRCVDQAQVHFQRAVRICPQDSLAHLNVGFCEQARGHFQEAISEYETALQSARMRYLKSRAYLNLGAAYDDQGLFDKARPYFEQGAAIAPQDPQIQRALAKVEAEQRVVELSKSVGADPTAAGYLQMGRLQEELGRVADARSSYENAIRLDPELVQARNALSSLEAAIPR